MTEEEILQMKPGSELNARVAEIIMGHSIVSDETFGPMVRLLHEGESVWDTPHPYSEDLTTAECVVDRMLELGYEDAPYWSSFGQGKFTKAEAICKAALLATSGGKVVCNDCN